MALIDKDQLISEIERRMTENCDLAGKADCFGQRAVEDNDILAFIDTLPEQPELKPMNIPSAGGGMSTTPPKFKLDVKPEQPVLPGIDKEGIPGKDFIPVEWVDACERYGKWKIVKAEQPVEGLEEEIERYWKEEMPVVPESDLNDIALHFYELGCIRTAVMYDDIEYNRQRAEEAEQSVEEMFKELGTTKEEHLAKSMDKVHLEMEIATYLQDWEDDDEIGLHLSTDEGCMPIELEDVRDLARHFAEWGAEHLKK